MKTDIFILGCAILFMVIGCTTAMHLGEFDYNGTIGHQNLPSTVIIDSTKVNVSYE